MTFFYDPIFNERLVVTVAESWAEGWRTEISDDGRPVLIVCGRDGSATLPLTIPLVFALCKSLLGIMQPLGEAPETGAANGSCDSEIPV